MEYLTLFFIITLIVIRIVETYLFIKKVSKLCHNYDWKYVNDGNDLLLLDIINNKKYYLTKEWSAYNFLYLKGPSPLRMFLSLKPMTIANQYNKEVVKKVMRYEVI